MSQDRINGKPNKPNQDSKKQTKLRQSLSNVDMEMVSHQSIDMLPDNDINGLEDLQPETIQKKIRGLAHF